MAKRKSKAIAIPTHAQLRAMAGGCSHHLWLALAQRREATHPDDAVKIYADHIATLLRDTGDRVYQQVVEYLQKIEKLQKRSKQAGAFAAMVINVRTAHARKRNLIKQLDRKGW